MKSTPPRLSVCMIVRNEAHQLSDCIRSVLPVADEIVVVDTGSTDETRETAREFTTQIFDVPWEDDFSKARNVSLERATGDYILWIDADDRMDADNAAKVIRLKDYFNDRRAYYFILQDMRQGIHGHSYHQLRCVPSHPAIRFTGRIHESLTDGISALAIPMGTTDIVVEHHGYSDADLLKAKIARNIRILQNEVAHGRDDHQIHYFLAMAHDYQGNGEQAIRSMEKALDLLERRRFADRGALPPHSPDPFILEAILFLAEHAFQLGSQDQARRYVCKAKSLTDVSASDPHDLQRLGCLLQRMGEHEEAIHRLIHALHLPEKVCMRPRPPFSRSSVWTHLAFSHLALKRADQVEHCVSQAIGEGAHRGNVWQSLGQMAMTAGMSELAEMAYGRARAMGDLSSDALCNWGLLEGRKGRYDMARSAYRQAIGMDHTHRETLANWAFLEWMLGNAAQACNLYDQLLTLGQWEPEALTARGVLAVREQDLARTRQLSNHLKQAIEQKDLNICRQSSNIGELPDASLWGILAGRFAEAGKPRLAQWARHVEAYLKQLS